MIIVRFTSGLGNQMFQYAFYLYLKKRYEKVSVKADLTWFYANNDHHGYELCRIFGREKDSLFSLDEATKGEIFKVTGLLPNLLKPRNMITTDIESDRISGFSDGASKAFETFRRYPNRILREINGKKLSRNIIDELSKDIGNRDIVRADGSVYNELYDLTVSLDENRDHYFKGFFTQEKYYKPVLDEVRRIFRFPALDPGNEKTADRIRSSESVGIHVRRGDYLTVYNGQFKVLSRSYYEAAIGEISLHTGKSLEELNFFVFSDDPDFVKKEFDWLPHKAIITDNTGEDSYKDMQLMSLCKHNVIANSTFSQWAALLNVNEDHITVYPADYLADEDNEDKTLKNWIKIKS
ncbi:MAG: alpha-1,2-fucosyltransferase [Lachnospiraceae bacterium]|nr:alpha-1,2-fucosyltransferase [Lachnospiraceae bacterium]